MARGRRGNKTADPGRSLARQERERIATMMRPLSSKAKRVVGSYFALPEEIRREIKDFLTKNG